MLQVSMDLRLGDHGYDSHVSGLRLRRAPLPVLDRLEVVFAPGVPVTAQPGAPVTLDLDGGEGATGVFTGRLTGVARSFSGTRIQAHGGAWELGRYYPSLCLEQIALGDVLARLCQDAGVDTGNLDTGPTLALYVANGKASALQEVARLAAHVGAIPIFDADGALHVTTEGGVDTELALRYGRELLDVHVTRILPDATGRTVNGEGAGDPASQQGRWVITDFAQGSLPAPGPEARRRILPELRTMDDIRLASAAWTARNAAAERPVRLLTWLIPSLVPGARLQLADMPSSVDLTEVRVHQVVHTLSAHGAATSRVWGHELESQGPLAGVSAALGSLGAAVGGLF